MEPSTDYGGGLKNTFLLGASRHRRCRKAARLELSRIVCPLTAIVVNTELLNAAPAGEMESARNFEESTCLQARILPSVVYHVQVTATRRKPGQCRRRFPRQPFRACLSPQLSIPPTG